LCSIALGWKLCRAEAHIDNLKRHQAPIRERARRSYGRPAAFMQSLACAPDRSYAAGAEGTPGLTLREQRRQTLDETNA